MKRALCTNCKFKTTDKCWPGPVMLCGHPYFKKAVTYEDAIIKWITMDNGDKEAVSDKCPWPESECVKTSNNSISLPPIQITEKASKMLLKSLENLPAEVRQQILNQWNA